MVTRPASVETNFAVSSLFKNWMRLFLSSPSTSWELGSGTSENILSVLYHREGTLTGAPWWPGEEPGVWWHRVPSGTLLVQPCLRSGELAIKGPSPQKAFVSSPLSSLLVLGKAHFSRTCLVSEISRFVTGGVSRSCGKPGTRFSLHHPFCLCNEGFCFPRQSLGVTGWISWRLRSLHSLLGCFLYLWPSHKKAY